jgi:hypothetical protein
LELIFAKKNVHKISNDGRKADFFIEYELCNFIIEVKSSLASYKAQSLMSPHDIAEIWSRLYEACDQCSSSIKEFGKANKDLITIIVITERFSLEAASFQYFSEFSGLLSHLRIKKLKFISWDELEYSLSRESLKKFVFRLLNHEKEEAMATEAVVENMPAHNYEHLTNFRLKLGLGST